MADGPVAIVGGGPAGLAAAIELRAPRRGRGGGDRARGRGRAGSRATPATRASALRDLRRPLSGPAYARRYAELARAAGVELLTETMVTGWSARRALELTGPGGRSTLEPAAVVLATGCRERPALGPPGAGQPARRRDDHRDAAAARLPAAACPPGAARWSWAPST